MPGFKLLPESTCTQNCSQLNLSVLRNEEAPRHDRIVGLKQTAVKVLLELPDTARNCILQTVSFYGWESSLGAKWGLKFYMNTFLAECPSQWVLQKSNLKRTLPFAF